MTINRKKPISWWGRPKVVCWDSPPPRSIRVQIEEVSHFDARGMYRVFGRGDHFPGQAAFHMDIWLNRQGNFFCRFWSRCDEVDECSLIIQGIPDRLIRKLASGPRSNDDWVPKAVRDKYDEWILSELKITNPLDL